MDCPFVISKLKRPCQKKTKNFDLIYIKGLHQFSSFEYDVPGDISSASFFIVLTLLSHNSELIIQNINLNPSRTGIIKILNRMNAKIKILNKKIYKGSKTSHADWAERHGFDWAHKKIPVEWFDE